MWSCAWTDRWPHGGAFAEGSSQTRVHVAVRNPAQAGTLLVDLARAIATGLTVGGSSVEARDCLLAAVATVLAGPPSDPPAEVPDPGFTVSVELRQNGKVLQRRESLLGACALFHGRSPVVLVCAPVAHLVALARALVAAVSREMEGPRAEVARSAFLRELVHAAMTPERYRWVERWGEDKSNE